MLCAAHPQAPVRAVPASEGNPHGSLRVSFNLNPNSCLNAETGSVFWRLPSSWSQCFASLLRFCVSARTRLPAVGAEADCAALLPLAFVLIHKCPTGMHCGISFSLSPRSACTPLGALACSQVVIACPPSLVRASPSVSRRCRCCSTSEPLFACFRMTKRPPVFDALLRHDAHCIAV